MRSPRLLAPKGARSGSKEITVTSPDLKPVAPRAAQAAPEAQAARRKLVRGAFAAPALLTVYSGNALATSSAKRCLVNQANHPTMVPVSNALDNFLRVQLQQTGASPSFSYWVRGSDLQIYKKASNSVYLTGSQWQAFNINTNTTGAVQGSAPTSPSASSKYAAIRFDAHGNVVGVGGGGGAGQTALAGTCWHSFAPTL
jgi:hypothetical protein